MLLNASHQINYSFSLLIDQRTKQCFLKSFPHPTSNKKKKKNKNCAILQLKFGSVSLAKKYMKRISRELQSSDAFQEEDLLLQGVRFAYRVHQFAGGFDTDAMQAFEELRRIGCQKH